MKLIPCCFLIGAIATVLSACGGPSAKSSSKTARAAPVTTITVATAANVQFAMKDLIREFEARAPVKVESVVGSSGKLTAQIQEGAPYDLFVSADMKYPEYLLKNNQAVGEVKVYAYGTLVAWSLTVPQIQETPAYLLGEKVKKVAIANPRNAPYGEEAMNYFKFYRALEDIKPKLVYGENIAQINQYVMSKAVDVGLTAKSVVLSPGINGLGHWLELPEDSYAPIEQGVVMTRYGQNNHPRESLTFFTFLFSEPAQKIFDKYGYKLPDQQPVQ